MFVYAYMLLCFDVVGCVGAGHCLDGGLIGFWAFSDLLSSRVLCVYLSIPLLGLFVIITLDLFWCDCWFEWCVGLFISLFCCGSIGLFAVIYSCLVLGCLRCVVWVLGLLFCDAGFVCDGGLVISYLGLMGFVWG